MLHKNDFPEDRTVVRLGRILFEIINGKNPMHEAILLSVTKNADKHHYGILAYFKTC